MTQKKEYDIHNTAKVRNQEVKKAYQTETCRQ